MIEKRFVPEKKGIRCAKTYNVLTPKGVCWHYTGNYAKTANADNHWSLWNRVDTGAHYVVDKDKILWCAPHNEVIWHAGPGADYTSFIKSKFPAGANSSLIGVELCICDGWPAIYQKAVELGVALCKQYGWDSYKDFYRHYDCTRKQCPRDWADTTAGGHVAWEKFKTDVANALAYSGPFKDMQGHWAESVVNKLYDMGIVKGSEGLYTPNAGCTRAEVVAMSVRIAAVLGIKEDRAPKKFTDIPNPKCIWATQAVYQANALGLFGGYDDGTFRPLNNITRAEFAVIVGNLFIRCGTSLPKASNIFSDVSNLRPSMIDVINGLTTLDIFKKGTGKFNPNDNLTRAELAVVLYRTLIHYGAVTLKMEV